MWIWGEKEGFMKRGKEGMLVITDKRIAFITKTNMTYGSTAYTPLGGLNDSKMVKMYLDP